VGKKGKSPPVNEGINNFSLMSGYEDQMIFHHIFQLTKCSFPGLAIPNKPK
jgi:hypothetical protein